MAANFSRSMNADLQQGVTDGFLKSLTPDRGGTVEMAQPLKRAAELQCQYGITHKGTSFHQGDKSSYMY